MHEPAFLVVAWDQLVHNTCAWIAGVDGRSPRSIAEPEKFLTELRDRLNARQFATARVRQKVIPKSSGKLRSLGIPTVADRVVKAAFKLVIEAIFEADVKPCSYGFPSKRRAQVLGRRPITPRPASAPSCDR